MRCAIWLWGSRTHTEKCECVCCIREWTAEGWQCSVHCSVLQRSVVVMLIDDMRGATFLGVLVRVTKCVWPRFAHSLNEHWTGQQFFFLSFIFIHSFAGVAGIFMHKCVSEKVTAIIYQCHRRSMYMFIYSCRAHNKWAGRLGSHSHTHRSKSARVMRIYSPCVVRCMRPIRRRRRIWVVPAGAPSQRDIIIINASGTSKAQTTYTYPRHMDRKYAETQFVWCFIFNYHKMWLIEHYLHDLHHLHQIRPYFVLNANGKYCAEPHILICVVCIYRMEFLWYSVSVFRR